MNKISIIILNYKTPKLTCDCIKSIIHYTRDADYEIVVVDNNSQDDSRTYLELNFSNIPQIKLIYSDKNLGFSGGNNLGVKNASGEYLFFLNSDTLLYENSLKLLFDEFHELSKNSKIGFIQPRLYLNKEKNIVQRTCAKIPTLLDLIQENSTIFQKIRKKKFYQFRYLDWDRNSSRFVDEVCGAAMFCKRDFFDNMEKFDETFFLYFEEYDICKRALMHGYKNKYTVVTSLIHLHNKSPNPSINKKIIYISSFLKYIFKNYIKL